MKEELIQTIKIAQSHIDGENVSLIDVLEAFNYFVERNTPISNRAWCKYKIPFAFALETANENGLIITDAELIDFVEKFELDTLEDSIEDRFRDSLGYYFNASPKGSLFASAIKENDIERLKIFFDWLKDRHYFNVFINSPISDEDDKKPIEIAAANSRKEIIQMLLENGAMIDSKIIENIEDIETKGLLKKAWQEQSKEAFDAIELGDTDKVSAIINSWSDIDLLADFLAEFKLYNNERKSLYEFAVEKEQTEIAEFIQKTINNYRERNLN